MARTRIAVGACGAIPFVGQFGCIDGRRADDEIQIGDVFGIDGWHPDATTKTPGTGLTGIVADVVLIKHAGKAFSLTFVGIHFHDEAPLLEIVLTAGATCGFAGPGECGQKNGGQDADDGNNDQELNEGKPLTVRWIGKLHCMILFKFFWGDYDWAVNGCLKKDWIKTQCVRARMSHCIGMISVDNMCGRCIRPTELDFPTP